MSHVLVSGSIAYDRIMDFPGLFKEHFLPEKLHNINVSFGVEGIEENFGGTAGNIAYNLALLSVEPKIISTAGSDFEHYEAHLKSQHIDSTSVQIDKRSLTASAYILTDKADNQITAFSFAAGNAAYEPLPATDETSCAIIGAGCLPDMQSLPAHYRAHTIPYFYDPAQQIPRLSAEDLQNGITGAEAVFGNDYELNLIAQKTGWDEEKMLGKTNMLVITLGEKGSRIVTRDGEKHVEAVKVPAVVDPTGAGDAYRAGFIAGFLRALSAETCARIAGTVAAYAVEKYGTQNHRFTLDELRGRYKGAYGEECPLM